MEGVDHRYERAVDARRARAAVGFEHVAIDPQRALAELVEIDDRPQAAANQPLNLDGTAIDLARLIAGLARVGAAGEHTVFGAQPALALADKERRHVHVDAAGAEHSRAPHAHEDAAGRLPRVAAFE